MTTHPSRLFGAVLVATLALASMPARAQEVVRDPVKLPTHWVQGFSRAVGGELLVYPWAYPGQARALLTRATDGKMRIEWETDMVPPGPPDDPITFIWHAGMASGYGAHRFALTLNGQPCATFTSGRTTADREWSLAGTGGCALSFKTTRVGTFDELFGFMMLTVPRRLVTGTPPRLAVTGEAADNRDYYMTFQLPVESWVRAVAEEARFKDGSRVVRVEVSRIADQAPMTVRSEGEVLWRGSATPGYSTVLVASRGIRETLPLAVAIDSRPALSQLLTLRPVRDWAIHLLPHSHVDIGYSDPQPEVERKQWKNLREAVALGERTKDYPPGARFRWNVEGMWSVESYLQQAGKEEREAFVRAAQQGVIGLQANYTNILTGLCTPEELARWTDAARRLSVEYGIPVGRSAMHTDIPGLSWNVVSALARAGVRYFSSGPNYMPGLPDRGDRIGHTLEALGDRPIWWQSPSGEERLLFWMTGRGYSWFHGLNMGKAAATAQQPILDYMKELAESGYPYDLVQVRYTIGGDNGPVDPNLPEFVKSWNETFQAPRLVIDTADSLFAEMERRWGSRIPTLAGDMTPYWEDGAVSTAREEALVRQAARRLQTAETVFAMRRRGVPAKSQQEAWRQVLLWHEHTWGAADSVSQPDREDVVAQWRYKQKFALEADRLATELLDSARPAPGRLVEVANPSSWERSGLVFLSAPPASGDRVLDPQGQPLPSQRLGDGRLVAWVRRVPALGATRLSITRGTPEPPRTPVRLSGVVMDNGVVRVAVDSTTGAITSLQVKEWPGEELVAAGQGLNAYLYVAGRDPAAVVGVAGVRVTVEDNGPLVATLRIESEAPGAKRLVRRVSVVAGSREVLVETMIDKSLVREKESVHLAFPFAIPGGTIRVDQGTTLMTVEKEQLSGSCRDFVGAQSAVDVSNATRGISVASLDSPLFELGALTDERLVNDSPRAWRTKTAAGSTLYAYAMNNYWHTNYKADQPGPVTLRFRLRPHAAFDPVTLRRFSAEADQPLLVSPVAEREPVVRPPFQVVGAGVLLSSLRPLPDGSLEATLYNASARVVTARLAGLRPGSRLTLIDAEGREQATAGPWRMKASAIVKVRIAAATKERSAR